MCVFVSRPMKIVTFLRKNDYSPKRVVDFPRERDTFRNKIMEIVEDFDEKSYNNNGKHWKSSRILRVNPNFFICSIFFIFLHVLSCSLIFVFFVFVGCSKSVFFFGLNFVTISLDNSYVKNQLLGPSRKVLFSFFSYFFLPFFVFFLAFYFFMFSHFLFISSFFDFLMFFIFFFIFSEEKVSSFLFSCISFKYF